MSDISYCYICSGVRCGSTLLDMLIGGHSRVASLGEFAFFGKAIALDQTCSCGSPMSTCASWDKVIRRIEADCGVNLRDDPYALRQWDTRASTKIDPSQQTMLYLAMTKLRTAMCDLRGHLPKSFPAALPYPRSLSVGIDNAFYLSGVVRQEWDKDLVIDSSKSVHQGIALYNAKPSQVRVIYLSRDGRGVYLSRRGRHDRKTSLVGWRDYYRRADTLLRKWVPDEHLYRLHYEDLAGDSENTLRKICAFLGLDFESQMTDLNAGERHLVNGNPTMHRRHRGVQLDERWKTGLVGEEYQYFMKYGGELNRRLGYS